MLAYEPDPLASRTLTGITRQPQHRPAIPIELPASAAMIPLTIVPWPLSSAGFEVAAITFQPATIFPARSGCDALTPVSTTATTGALLEPVVTSQAAPTWTCA